MLSVIYLLIWLLEKIYFVFCFILNSNLDTSFPTAFFNFKFFTSTTNKEFVKIRKEIEK